MGDTDGSTTEPLFAPGAREAEQGGQHGVIADGEFVSDEHYSQRANWLRAGACGLMVVLTDSQELCACLSTADYNNSTGRVKACVLDPSYGCRVRGSEPVLVLSMQVCWEQTTVW